MPAEVAETRRLMAAAVAALSLALVLSACSLFREDPRSKMAQLPEFTPTVEVRTLWSASVGASDEFSLSPAIVGNGVFAAARDGTVVRLEAASGREVWRYATRQTLSGGVGVGGDLVSVGTSEGEVIALEAASGEPRWRARVSSEVLVPPVVAGDVVIVRCSDSRIFALDARDGKRRWVYQRAMPTLTVRSPAGVAVNAQMIYAGFAGGRLTALSLASGALRWEAAVALPRGATELERVADVVGVPWVSEREVCAVAYQGRVACFDAANGQPLWSRELSSITGLAADARFVFSSDDRGAVHALDRSNGTSFWKQDRLFLRQLTVPLPLGREIVVGDVQGYIHVLSRESGQFIGRAAMDGSALNSPMVPTSEGWLAQTRGGNVYALVIRNP
jgi:outer membrane protein assembly factor BamB